MTRVDSLDLQVAAAPSTTDALYRRVAWRIMPMLFIGYIIAYMDRVNVGFAKLQMVGDLKFSEAIYGFGAGIFFLGYFLFEVPSNVILHKVGARIWIFRVMAIWGIVSALTAFVHTAFEFYSIRFLLGIAEAGFFPGMVLYLTYWFPSHRRGKMVAMLMAGNPVSGIVGGPISGYILDHAAGAYGLAGWQWLFIIEALPAVVLAFVILFFLEDRIATSKSFTDEEKAILTADIEAEAGVKTQHSIMSVFTSWRVWLMCAILFGIVMGSYGLGFWQPTIIRQTGVTSSFTIGLLTMIPYTVAFCSMLLVGRSADRMRERRWHIMIPNLVAASGFIICTLAQGNIVLSMIGLSMAAGGVVTSLPMFWALPTSFLGGTAAAAGIALINCTGNLAGFVSPAIVGWLKSVTGSFDSGLYLMGASLALSALLIFTLVPAKMVNR